MAQDCPISMYILDTDHLSLIQRNGQEGKQILTRLSTIADLGISVTVITYEEQVRGRLAVVSKAKTIEAQVVGYQRLEQLIVDYRSISIIDRKSVV